MGREAQGAHRQGSEWAAVIIVGYWCLAYSLYAGMPNLVTGILLGLGGAWLGLTVQHCGNHGAMSTKVWVNKFLGLMDDLSGGSSLMWRSHHQVSHHIHCNDDEMDEDVFSSYPVVRFDHRMPQRWWHKYQHIYMWFAYPILTLGFHVRDVAGMLAGSAPGATLYGATRMEKASVILGKIVHFSLVYAVPMYFHGIWAGMVAAFGYFSTQGIVLATTFAVSHNVPETKPGTPVPLRSRGSASRRAATCGLGDPAAGDLGELGRQGGVFLHGRPEPPDRAPHVPCGLLHALPGYLPYRQGRV